MGRSRLEAIPVEMEHFEGLRKPEQVSNIITGNLGTFQPVQVTGGVVIDEATLFQARTVDGEPYGFHVTVFPDPLIAILPATAMVDLRFGSGCVAVEIPNIEIGRGFNCVLPGSECRGVLRITGVAGTTYNYGGFVRLASGDTKEGRAIILQSADLNPGNSADINLSTLLASIKVKANVAGAHFTVDVRDANLNLLEQFEITPGEIMNWESIHPRGQVIRISNVGGAAATFHSYQSLSL